MTDDARTPITDAQRAELDGMIAWVADHSDPPATLDSHGAIMDYLDGLLSADFMGDYGPEEFFAMGMAWGEALRLGHDGWVWVALPTQSGATLALDLTDDPALGPEAPLVTPGHLFVKRAEIPNALIEPHAMESLLMAELAAA